MNKLNVGDYVRTKDGCIGKIIDVNLGDFQIRYELDNSDEFHYKYKSGIIKSSPNIIDLIEEHDILKIEEQKGVYTICEVETFKEPYKNYVFFGVRLNNRPIAKKLYELNIKSIVTKESFENISYKVGE